MMLFHAPKIAFFLLSALALTDALATPGKGGKGGKGCQKSGGGKTPKGCPGAPLNFGLVVFPAFQALDIFGPLDALNLLSLSLPLNLSIISSDLSPVSTRPVSPKMLLPNSRFEQQILPTHTFSTAPTNLEVLIVPGGLGTRNPTTVPPIISYLRQTYPSLRYILSICTGSGLLARADILDNKKATTNKAGWNQTIALGPKVKWVKKARWVEDGNVWTSSGVSAGMDMTLAWIDETYGLREEVDPVVGKKEKWGDYLGRMMEYTREKNAGKDPWAAVYQL